MDGGDILPFADIRAYDKIPCGRTGAYRTRRGWFGKAILQYQWKSLRSPQSGGGYEIGWSDEYEDQAPYVLVFDTPWFLREYKPRQKQPERIDDCV